MTPLHILAWCSTYSVQCLELYQLLFDKYPANLIKMCGGYTTSDAIWGDAPCEIVEFLITSYQSLFDWNGMVITLGQANAPTSVIQNLLDIQHTLSPGHNIDWDQIIVELARATSTTKPITSPATFCFLTRCSIATRVTQLE